MSLKSRFRTIVAFVTTVCFSASSFAATTAPSGFVESLFHYARTNQVKKIRYLVHDMGYDIDSENEKGDTAYCIAKEKNNVYAMELLASFGANAKQRCGMPWGVIGTVAGVAAVGGIAAAAGGGGGGGGSGNSCKDVVCGTHEHCSNGKCVCDEDYGKYGSEQCHLTMPCVHGIQYNDKCLCDGEGYKDKFCSVCLDGYEQAANGSCQAAECAGYTLTSCPANASSCSKCQSGTVTKYKVDNCIEGYKGDECDSCAPGYDVFDDGCYWNLHCENNTIGSTGKQIGNSCECNEGYKGQVCNECDEDNKYYHYETAECHLTLECNETGGKQQGNKCVCNDGYDGELCDKCEQGYDWVAGECKKVLDCGEHGKQEGDTCVCDEGYGRDATGKCVAKSSSAYEPVSKEKANFVNEEIDITNSNYVDVIGKNYDESVKNPEAQIRGNQYDLYLSYIDLNAYITTDQTIDHKATINIKNLSDGDVYALKTNEAKNIFLSFLSLDTNNYSKEGTESALIKVTNGGKIEGTEKFYTGGNGDVYGVYGSVDTNLYALAQELTSGASVDNDKLDRTTEINITSIGSGDVYGMYGQDDIYNTLFNVTSGSHSATENAKIKVTSTGSGNVYGIYSVGGIHTDSDTTDEIINGGIIEATSHDGDANGIYLNEEESGVSVNMTTLEGSTITATATGSGDAYGIYDYDNSNITHNGTITAISAGGVKEMDPIIYADAYGISSTTGKIITNSGSTISATNTGSGNAYGIYGESMISYTKDDTTYSGVINGGNIDVTTKDGDAYGIYGKDGSTITNAETITAKSDNGKTYGVALDNSMIENNGTINVGFAPEDQTDPDNPDTPFGTGEVYGIKASNGSEITNAGTITAISAGGVKERIEVPGIGGKFIYADAYGISSNTGKIITNSGSTISATNTGSGNAYGAHLDDSIFEIDEYSTISVTNTGSGNAYGIRALNGSEVKLYEGTISATAKNGDAYGAHLDDSIFEIYADSTITAINTGSGKAYGIYAENCQDQPSDPTKKTITHNGKIDVKSNNESYGVILKNSNIKTVAGSVIEVESIDGYGPVYGIYDLGGSEIYHQGNIQVKQDDMNTYGIYIDKSTEENSVSKVSTVNSSKITVNSKFDGEAYGIYDLDGSKITHKGHIKVTTEDGNAYGIKSDDGTVEYAEYRDYDEGKDIDVTSTNGDVWGIKANKVQKVPGDNSGNPLIIGVNSTNGNAIGIEGEDITFAGEVAAISGNNTIGIKGENIVSEGFVTAVSNYDGDDLTEGFAIGIQGTNVNMTMNGKVNVNTVSGPATGIVAKNGTARGFITVKSQKSSASGVVVSQGDNYKLYLATVGVTGNHDSDEVYGVCVDETGSVTIENSNITVENKGKGAAYGIYSKSSGDVTVTNSSTINVTNNAGGEAYGIYKENGSVIVDSSSKIVVNTIIDEKAYGIYAKDANVENYGEIILNGLSNKGGMLGLQFVVEIHDSVYTNLGLTSTSYALNFDDIDGTMALGKGGVYEALSLAGTMAVDSSVVEEGFADTYVEEEALKSSEIDVTAVSSSAMFDAKVEKNTEKDSANVIMTRKSFAELSASSSVAKFLEQNYAAQNNSVLFKNLKQATASSYAKTEAELLGYALLPNFAQENMSVLRNLNATLNDELFTTKGAERKIVGYDHLYRARDTKGTLTGYENYANTMYFMYDVEGDNLIRKGFGMGITQFRSDYDDDSDRKDLMVQAFVPVSYIKDSGLNFASIARFGYSDGEYERHTSNGVFESDLTSWIYGLSNAVRYGFDMGGLIIEPTAEFNVLGYYQNRIRENNNKAMAIKADAENNLSVEMGLGVNIRKDVQLNEHSSLSFNANAMYYHEFAKPYHSLEASMRGMDGKYLITDYENVYDRDRAMLSLGLDYNYKPFTFYGKFKQFIEDENPFEANIGVKYNF